MPYITEEMKQKDPDWYHHLKVGDSFHAETAVECGVCGCESNYWAMARWMTVPKLCLICPANEMNPSVHEAVDRKKELVYEDELPASVIRELKREIIQMKSQLRAQVAAAARTS